MRDVQRRISVVQRTSNDLHDAVILSQEVNRRQDSLVQLVRLLLRAAPPTRQPSPLTPFCFGVRNNSSEESIIQRVLHQREPNVHFFPPRPFSEGASGLQLQTLWCWFEKTWCKVTFSLNSALLQLSCYLFPAE